MTSDPSNGDRMYRRLDLAPEASAEQIGRAYRRLAHSHHPDSHPEDPEAAARFREITEAYEILSDPDRRALYDRNRQIPATSHRPPTRPAASSTAVTPTHHPGHADGHPIFIGLGSFTAGPGPLVAGPVHITPSSTLDGAAPDPTGDRDRDLAQLLDAVLRAWRWR